MSIPAHYPHSPRLSQAFLSPLSPQYSLVSKPTHPTSALYPHSPQDTAGPSVSPGLAQSPQSTSGWPQSLWSPPPPQPPVRFSSSQSIPAPPVCLGPRQPTPVHPIPQPLSTPARRLQYPRPPAGSAAAPLSPASSGGAVGPPRAGARAPAPGPGRASALPGQAGCLGPYLGCPGRGGGGWLRGLGARRQLGGARGVLTPGLLRGQPVVAAVLLEGEGVGRLGEADLGAWRGERG